MAGQEREPEAGGGERAAEVSNRVEGGSHQHLVQAHSIGEVHLHSAAPRAGVTPVQYARDLVRRLAELDPAAAAEELHGAAWQEPRFVLAVVRELQGLGGGAGGEWLAVLVAQVADLPARQLVVSEELKGDGRTDEARAVLRATVRRPVAEVAAVLNALGPSGDGRVVLAALWDTPEFDAVGYLADLRRLRHDALAKSLLGTGAVRLMGAAQLADFFSPRGRAEDAYDVIRFSLQQWVSHVEEGRAEAEFELRDNILRAVVAALRPEGEGAHLDRLVEAAESLTAPTLLRLLKLLEEAGHGAQAREFLAATVRAPGGRLDPGRLLLLLQQGGDEEAVERVNAAVALDGPRRVAHVAVAFWQACWDVALEADTDSGAVAGRAGDAFVAHAAARTVPEIAAILDRLESSYSAGYPGVARALALGLFAQVRARGEGEALVRELDRAGRSSLAERLGAEAEAQSPPPAPPAAPPARHKTRRGWFGRRGKSRA
ncbi:hypothetical protein AB0J38_24510 [Streptomyces sp. NPDC050095]|uniref:hypothetical protein n=1 Tax=unclassified Streptomyces TaxID=2593676 RepID=UPI00342D485A